MKKYIASKSCRILFTPKVKSKLKKGEEREQQERCLRSRVNGSVIHGVTQLQKQTLFKAGPKDLQE